MGTIGFLADHSGQRMAAPGEPVYGYTVVRSYPHDRAAFTQGLLFRNGVFYESTGLNGRSGIRKVKIDELRPIEALQLLADLQKEL